ncbi:hypothetical protein [Ramlibacter rhizophilus]|uniref:Uncharacterized protein n=1 Tax=Ramlibacter rhizophilus TaxID=1781167 RepID=A0A4Z0BZW9_9BURK|nr:hypothetical protein [Ramlibacter rhizophilus]TFZ04511.1 hypothetical protein EZ242_01810 [Ramlibacter rhizophilus]
MKKLLPLALVLFSAATHAGAYSDDLAKCLVRSTSSNDRNDLVRWMFAVSSVHPALSTSTRVGTEALEEANRKTAVLLNRLLTQDCLQQARHARRYEGDVAIFNSFKALGEVASLELFRHPAVNSALTSFTRHIDSKKIDDLTLR